MEWVALYITLGNVYFWTWVLTEADLGSFPDYLTVLVATAALWFAAKAASAGRQTAVEAARTNETQAKQLERLQREQVERDIEKRKAHASQISVWYIRTPSDGASSAEYMVLFSNGSKMPVAKVCVTLCGKSGPMAHSSAITYIPPEMGGKENYSEAAITKLLNANLENIEQTGFGLQDDTICVAFNDMDGVRWTRNFGGELRKLHPDQLTKFHPIPES